MKTLHQSFTDAVKDIKNGSTLMVGGFGLCGIPENLLQCYGGEKNDRREVYTEGKNRNKSRTRN